MSTPLNGLVAVVTGSSRSIGAAAAKRLAADGASVIINYVSNESAAAQVVGEINTNREGAAIAVKADVGTIAGGQHLLDETVKHFGKVDILVLNAGIMGSRVLADVDEDFFDWHFNNNVKGPLFLAKAASPLLKAGGRIIFFSTSLTKNSSIQPNALTYTATKGAIEQISRVLAKDLGTRGITVNTVSPGPVDTPLFREGKTEQVIGFVTNLHPARRLGESEDIAPIVAFLASPAAGWVNGQNIFINGGSTV